MMKKLFIVLLTIILGVGVKAQLLESVVYYADIVASTKTGEKMKDVLHCNVLITVTLDGENYSLSLTDPEGKKEPDVILMERDYKQNESEGITSFRHKSIAPHKGELEIIFIKNTSTKEITGIALSSKQKDVLFHISKVENNGLVLHKE